MFHIHFVYYEVNKDELSPSKTNCVIWFDESLLKMLKNASYFISRYLSVCLVPLATPEKPDPFKR